MLKATFVNSSGGKQFCLLLLLLLIGEFLSAFLGLTPLYLLHGLDADLMDHPMLLRIAQLFSSLGAFLFPALMIAWLCSHDIKKYLFIGSMPDIQMIVLSMICMFFLALPISFLENLITKLLTFPDFMSPLLEWMKEMDLRSEKLMMLLLKDNDIGTLFFNLIVIAVAAGVCEEFFFRGAMQRVVGKWVANPHLVIWIVAFVFSVFHFQLYGFLSRVLLGAFLGYLLYWSGNIWVPVFAHFANNGIAVLAMSNQKAQDATSFLEGISQEEMLPVAIASFVALLFFIYFCNRLRLRLEKKRV